MGFSSAARSVKLYFQGDTKGLERAISRADSKLQKFNRGAGTKFGNSGLLGGVSKGGALAIGGGVLASQALKATQAASDLNEQISKTNVVFASSGESVINWSKDLATSFGLAQTEALTAASTFGALFSNTGKSQAEAAKLSKSVVQLGADLASFNNTSVQEALDALRSGLSGEIEPLRRFQVFLTEASVQQQALADTGKTSVKQLTQGEKIFARYELIMRQTTKAQGDFARTSGGLANQQRILQAQVANLEVALGKGLVPALTKVTVAANETITAAGHLGSALSQVDASTGGFLGDALEKTTKLTLLLNPTGQIFLGIKGINDLFGGTKTQLEDINKLASQFAATIGGINLNPGGAPTPTNPGGKKADQKGPPAFGEPGFKTGKAPPVPLGPSASQKNRIFDNKITRELDRAQDIESPKARIARLQAIRAQVEAERKRVKDPTRKLNLGDEVVQIDREIKGLNDDIKQGLKDKAAAIKAAAKKTAQAFKQQSSDIKNAVLDAFDTKSTKIDNARNLADAKENLRKAKQLGSAGVIKLAKRDVDDANRAVQRQKIVDTPFRVTEGPKGPVNTLQAGSVTININSNQDPDKIAAAVIAKIQKKGRHGTHQSRGTIASRNFNVGIN